MDQILRIAVQKKGRLSEDSLALIKECGIKVGWLSSLSREMMRMKKSDRKERQCFHKGKDSGVEIKCNI